MTSHKPFATTALLALAAASAINLAIPRYASADQSATAQAPATRTDIKENTEAVREMTHGGNLVVGKDGSKHPETGPAKPIEYWMSACPPHGEQGKLTSDDKNCRKPDDSGKTTTAN